MNTYKNQSTVNINDIDSGGSPAACKTMRIATGATDGTPADPMEAMVAAKLKGKVIQFNWNKFNSISLKNATKILR